MIVLLLWLSALGNLEIKVKKGDRWESYIPKANPSRNIQPCFVFALKV